MIQSFIIFIILLLMPCFGKDEIVQNKKNTIADWQYVKIPLAEIQKKVVDIEKRAVYVQIEKRYYRKGKDNEIYIYNLSGELKKILKEWKNAKHWATRTKNGFFFTPAFYYKLDFLDENKKIIESIDMNLWYRPKGELNFISVKEKILSLFKKADAEVYQQVLQTNITKSLSMQM